MDCFMEYEVDCVQQLNLVLQQFDRDTKTPFDVCHKIF